MVIVNVLLSVIAVSLISVLAAIPFLLKRELGKPVLLVLLSVSVGSLLGSVFIHFIPEVIDHGYSLVSAVYILAGFFVFFLLEKVVHHHHRHKHDDIHGHAHGYSLAPVNLIGDGVHNFIDGMIIAGSYLVSPPLGLAATVSVIFHEVPQEIADFGVLLYAGLSRKKAVLFNLLSALTAVVGAVIGLFIGGVSESFSAFIVPFAAGNFLYIAASNLLPELHRHCGVKETVYHLLAILLGISIMVFLAVFSPAHAH